MRDLGRKAAPLADRDRLLDAVQDLARLFAHVGGVDPAHLAGDAGQLDHLLGRREGARHVEEAGRHPEGAVAHPLAHQLLHLGDLLRRRLAVHAPDHLLADRALADEAREVRGGTGRRHGVEEGLQRDWRAAVRPLHERRHALTHVVVGRRHAQDAAARVRVQVDEAGRDHRALDVDAVPRGARQPRRDRHDRVAAHRQLAAVPGPARPVDDATVQEDEVVVLRREPSGAHGQRQRGDDQQRPRYHLHAVSLSGPHFLTICR